MPIRAVTFDCAQTLVRVDLQWDRFAAAGAARIGIDVSPQQAMRYHDLYMSRLPEFLDINLRKDRNAGSDFYFRLGRDWLEQMGLGENAPAFAAATDDLAFGSESILFAPYEDSVPALRAAKMAGLKVAVVSNWDYTLHRVLELFGLSLYVDVALASLEEGVEKPDPRLFHKALSALGCPPEEVFHVGDDPVDDLQGAAAAGIRASLIDRSLPPDLPSRMSTLAQLSEAIACLG